MNKNNKNINSNQNHGDHCQHVQIGGQAYYDDRKYFLFSPDAPVPQAVESFRKAGVGQQMSDGTFDFVPQPRERRAGACSLGNSPTGASAGRRTTPCS